MMSSHAFVMGSSHFEKPTHTGFTNALKEIGYWYLSVA